MYAGIGVRKYAGQQPAAARGVGSQADVLSAFMPDSGVGGG